MKFDVFLSICQTEVAGYMPSEKEMWSNFFDQVRLADELGFGVAWVAETHLSCEVQKQGAQPVIPHFKGEIGLNTDILQVAHMIFADTRQIEVGSAIRNIFCNGGPIAHAEAIRTFLSLHEMTAARDRRLHIGFASGRFEFSNRPYGIFPRSKLERVAWPVVKGKILYEATEIFLRLLRGEILSSDEVSPQRIERSSFRLSEEWERAQAAVSASPAGREALVGEEIQLNPFWSFERLAVLPRETPLNSLTLTIGSHDPGVQELANSYWPVGVFNLSITPPEVIEATHQRMKAIYHPDGGPWRRDLMPRTVMIFLEDAPGRSDKANGDLAKQAAKHAWENYWLAMEGTLDTKKVAHAVTNSIAGHPQEVAELLRAKYHPDDRLMLWFDFNNHDNEGVKNSMRIFMKKVSPLLKD